MLLVVVVVVDDDDDDDVVFVVIVIQLRNQGFGPGLVSGAVSQKDIVWNRVDMGDSRASLGVLQIRLFDWAKIAHDFADFAKISLS